MMPPEDTIDRWNEASRRLKPTSKSFQCGEDLAQALVETSAEVEQLRVQLAGCLTAAEGYIHNPANVAKQGDYGWSVAYEKVKELRLKYENPYTLVVGNKQ